MHVDWQQVTALGIVSVAALSVGRRMWGQIAALWRPGKTGGGGCDGCPSAGGPSARPKAASPLMQIQTRPPAHLRRPPPE